MREDDDQEALADSINAMRDEQTATELNAAKEVGDVDDNDIGTLIGLEKEMYPDETDAQRTKRLFRENSSHAASQIVHIAMHGSSERLKLDASKYIVERVLGPLGSDNAGEKSPIEGFLEDIVNYANTAGGE